MDKTKLVKMLSLANLTLGLIGRDSKTVREKEREIEDYSKLVGEKVSGCYIPERKGDYSSPFDLEPEPKISEIMIRYDNGKTVVYKPQEEKPIETQFIYEITPGEPMFGDNYELKYIERPDVDHKEIPDPLEEKLGNFKIEVISVKESKE